MNLSIPVKTGAIFILSAAVLMFSTFQAECKELKPEQYYSDIAKYLSRFMPRQHLLQTTVDDSISRRTWTNFLNIIDFEHKFFLQSDIDNFSKYQDQLDDMIKEGDLSFAYTVYEVLKQRAADRFNFTSNILAKGIDINLKDEFKWKRKNMPWPKDQAEWDDLWYKIIKNEYVRLRIAKEEADKIPATNKVTSSTNTAAVITPPVSPEESIAKRYQKLLNVLEDNDAESVMEQFLNAFTLAYDPHSNYMAPESLEDFNIDMQLSLDGIGAVLSTEDGAAKIEKIIPGGPADLDKRLKQGDKIIAVGQEGMQPEDILHLPLKKIVSKVRGPRGSKVTLVVIAASDPSGITKVYVLTRGEVKLEDQAAKWKLYDAQASNGKKKKIAVITLPSFYATMKSLPSDSDYRSSAEDVHKALLEIATNNVDGVILDIRNNGGGSLVDAVRMTGLFIPTGPAVQVKETESDAKIMSDRDPEVAYKGPLIVLVNRLSASASEILAGALQDFGRAVIVGDSKTHGKGTVQTVLKLSRNPKYGSVKITTAVFYRISGLSTQLKGVIPDISITSPLDFMELGEDSLDNPVSCVPIAKADYQTNDLTRIIGELKTLSEKRRSTDPQFVIYNKFLVHVEKLFKNETMPLDIVSRRELAKSEKEMNDLQKKMFSDNTEKDEKNEKSDIVLNEGLRIVADYSAIQSNEDLSQPAVQTIIKPKNLFVDMSISLWTALEATYRWIEEVL